MDLAVGTKFTISDKTYIVSEGHQSCGHCAFINDDCAGIRAIIGNCSMRCRADRKNVVFKEIKAMNQINIDIPEGMVIDAENSDLAKGIIKFKKHYADYAEVVKTIEETVGKHSFFAAMDTTYAEHRDYVVAYAKFLDVVQYYNGEWVFNPTTENETGYCIALDNPGHTYIVMQMNTCVNVYFGQALFKTREAAQKVIDNPNFRALLDIVYKYKK